MEQKTTHFEPFPAEKQAALERARAEKLKSVAHFPKPVNLPGFPQMPMAIPVDPQQQARPQAQQRPGFTISPEAQADAMFSQAAMQAPSVPMVPRAQPQPQMQQPQRVAPQLVQEYVNQVAATNPGVITPVADAEYMSLELPSRFAYYGFTDLYVCPFRAKHLGKLQKANREQSMLAMVEAVSAVCYTTNPAYAGAAMAFELTLPDFFFVLYWLRLNSFTKSNYVHTAMCENEDHIRRVSYTMNPGFYDAQLANGEITAEERDLMYKEAMNPESLKLSQILTNTTLVINELETVPDPTFYCFDSEPRIRMRPPTMRDVLDFAEAPERKDPELKEEFSFLAQLASHIQHTEMYMDLRTRIKVVGECSPDEVQLLKGFERQIKGYGVEETVKIQCKECGAVSETKLSLAAHSFFPSDER